MEVRPMREFRFVPTSLFPHIDLQSILEMEFKISETLGIPLNFDDMDFLQFHWRYRRVLEKIQADNKRITNDILPNIMRR